MRTALSMRRQFLVNLSFQGIIAIGKVWICHEVAMTS